MAYPKALKTLGDHIRKRRLDLGLVQKHVAEQLEVDTASMGNRGMSPQDDRFAPKNLVKARQRLGLSQTAFAKRLGISWWSVATGNRVGCTGNWWQT